MQERTEVHRPRRARPFDQGGSARRAHGRGEEPRRARGHGGARRLGIRATGAGGHLRGRAHRLSGWRARCEAAGHRVPGGRTEPDPRAPASGSRTTPRRRAGWRGSCAAGELVRGAGARSARRGRPRSGARPRGRPRRSDARPPSALQAAAAPRPASRTGAPGRARHEAWLRRQRLDEPAAQAAFDDYYAAVLRARLRRERLDAAIAELAGARTLAPVVGRLSCLRGVGTLTAFALAVEIGDWHRLSGASDRRLPGPHPERDPVGLTPHPRPDHQDRQRPRPPAPGRGRLAPPPPAARERARSSAGAPPTPRGARPRRGRPGCAFTTAGISLERAAAFARRSSRWPSRASWRAGAGALP